MKEGNRLELSNTRLFQYFLLTSFPLVLLAFNVREYKMVFIIMVFLLLLIMFITSESTRFLIWSFNTFLFSYILILYSHRILENLLISSKVTLLLGEILQLVAIIMLFYVNNKFKRSLHIGFQLPKWKVQTLIIVVTLVALLLLLGLFTKGIQYFLWVVSICLFHAVFYEILWRGLLLPLFSQVLGNYWGIIMLSVSFGVYIHNFGYSMFMSILMSIFSVILSITKLKTKSIFPSMAMHFCLFYLLNSIQSIFIFG